MINTRRAVVLAAATLATATAAGALAAPARAAAPRPVLTPAEHIVGLYLDAHRTDQAKLRNFFYAMPKGGDLHNHLSGAVSTELLVSLAVGDGLCIDKSDTAVPPPCAVGTRPATDTVTDPAFRAEVIRAWSMQDFVEGAETGHDHFFATFGKFGEVSGRHPGAMLADVADTGTEQHQEYLETMLTPASAAAAALAAKVGYDPDFAAMRAKLIADGGLASVVATARADADKMLADFRSIDKCGTTQPRPGCKLTVRFISQVSRASTPARVFTQMLVGMELAEVDPRFVAVNLVQPEDLPASLQNYSLQMHMLDYLHPLYPHAHISLHAGELTPALVSPADLAFHIREAVNVGHAERIGHGVDVTWEDDSHQLLRELAAKNVAIEVPLTSNQQILKVAGPAHPFPLYRAYGVPTVLATDDPGVERVDISGEYQRAESRYQLGYRTMKDLARDSLDYGFLPGKSLWADRDHNLPVAQCRILLLPAYDTPRCRGFLADNAKAALEAKQEKAFTGFEAAVLTGRLPVAPPEPGQR